LTDFQNALLAQLSLTCSDAKRVFAQHIGMSQTRVQLLMLLSHGETSHAILQERLALDGATLTRQVKQFEAEGIVTRRLDPQDNRYTLVTLTTSGQQIAAGLVTAYKTFEARLLEGIARQSQETMLAALEQIRANIRRVQDE
jgi:DNA-binding MarR family transcriptional regulator